MKAQTPYWPLFRNEIGMDHSSKLPWSFCVGIWLLGWLVASFVPLVLIFKVSEGNMGTLFASFGDLIGFAMVWWLAMGAWTFGLAVLPGISNSIQSARAFEFMFTRAIDRRRLFRTRAAVIHGVLLGPLLINLMVSSGLPVPTLAPESADPASAISRREHYLKAFPNSHAQEGKSMEQPAPIVIPRGAIVLTGWILWLGALGLLFMQGWCVLLARRVQNNPWLAGITIGLPVLATFFLAPWIPRHYPHFYEDGFLFFARNLVPLWIGLLALIPAVQIFSERRFRDLEIP